MSTARLNFAQLSPQLYKGLGSVNAALAGSTLGQRLIELVFLRVSQINGCAYCVDMHARDLLKYGEDAQRINSVITWHEVDFYDARERAALAWAEAVTDIGETRAPDALFEGLRTVGFSDKEISDLTFAIAVMNAWNRMSIALRNPVARAPALAPELAQQVAHA